MKKGFVRIKTYLIPFLVMLSMTALIAAVHPDFASADAGRVCAAAPSAQRSESSSALYDITTQFGYVDDQAELFSKSEKESLQKLAAANGRQIGAVLAIATVSHDTGKEGTSYARSYLLDHEYGFGSGKESILFLIDMKKREYTVYEYNKYASGYLLTDYEGDLILDALETPMKAGDYYQAAEDFLNDCRRYAFTTLGGNYQSSGDLHRQEPRVNWLICLLAGLAGGGITTAAVVLLRNQDEKTSAVNYAPKGSFRIVNQENRYLRTTVTKHKIETNSGSSHSSGGGGGFSGGGSGGGHGGSRGF